jgi:hypothetical protein
MKKRKVRYGTVQYNNKLYRAEFLEVMREVYVEPVTEKTVNIFKLNGKLVGQAVQETFQDKEAKDMNPFGLFHKLENVSTDDLIKELAGRQGTTSIKNKSDQQIKITAGEKSRIKEKCEATILVIRGA